MVVKNKSIIIKFEGGNEQTIGDITKIVGFVKARFFVSLIDCLNLEANPRSSKTGAVTDAIQETIENSPALFPFMTKGVLLGFSNYERLERGRIKVCPENPQIEGILDGGHNTLAIGLHILKKALEYHGENMSRSAKTWDDFKKVWNERRNMVEAYLDSIQKGEETDELDFFVPVELVVPRDLSNTSCVYAFKNQLLEICEARNNNAELQLSAKANQKGYFDDLKELLENHNRNIANRVEWKTNDGGEVKAQDIVALAWIPLNLITPVRDESSPERTIEGVAPNKLYSGKGACMKQFERLMSSPDVTTESDENYKRELINAEVKSAFEIAVGLPELYDYIYELFPKLYNAAGGRFYAITAAKKLNDKRKIKTAPFCGKKVESVTPDGFIAPLVYGLQALMTKREVDGKKIIVWSQAPMPFLHNNLDKIVANYMEIFSVCDYDPQKVGKASVSYNQALSAFKMAIAGIL